jgi:hypothetical protein
MKQAVLETLMDQVALQVWMEQVVIIILFRIAHKMLLQDGFQLYT